MSKRTKSRPVLPPTVWYSCGDTPRLPTRALVLEHCRRLIAEGRLERAGLSSPRPNTTTWWAFDAAWTTSDGARVRARMTLAANPGGDRDAVAYESDSSLAVPGAITITAEADRPWDFTWPSPATMFLDRKWVWGPKPTEFGASNAAGSFHASGVDLMVADLDKLPWCITVISHDPRLWESPARQQPEPSLVRRLPAGLLGRIVEIRVHGPDVIAADRFLSRRGLSLERGGATLVPSPTVRHNLSPSELVLPSQRLGVLQLGGPGALGDAATRVAAAPWRSTAAAWEAVVDLRDNWLMEMEAEPDVSVLARVRARADMLAACVEEAAQRDRQAQKEIAAANAQRDQAVEAARAAGAELERLRRQYEHDARVQLLTAARGELTACRAELDQSEALVDDQHRRIAWLRKRLMVQDEDVAAEPDSGETLESPTTWDELFDAVDQMSFVLLGTDVPAAAASLRCHTHERLWVHRSWEALRALESYGRTKYANGASAVPHFAAYLRMPAADLTIPASRYAPTESSSVTASGRFRQARTFPVPAAVCDRGRVLMHEHIRIGTGQPPAPRLHFYDDTSGTTGKVRVGYLGKHLPSPATN
ncbi:hypothetical protein [Streptomyces anulatus]|uniref:hypothetical protein n=1 Tax=Streptomyces anulatus TaxID=1892 RepID=UPI001C266C2E|nr:hypothetical protein [Streptomyces anulatus]